MTVNFRIKNAEREQLILSQAAGEERNHATESENGASSAETGSPELKQEFSSKEHEMIGNYVSRLTRFAGALDCVANQQC